jgi:uncharacterized protein with HEPN domain
MPRDVGIYLRDILEAIDRIQRYTAGMDQAAFAADSKTSDAVLHNLEIIGEAAKRIVPAYERERRTSSGARSPACATCSPTSTSRSIS